LLAGRWLLIASAVPVVLLGRGLVSLLGAILVAALGLALAVSAGRGLLVISLLAALLFVSRCVLAFPAELQGDHSGSASALLIPADQFNLLPGLHVELEDEVAVVIRSILVPLVALDEEGSLAGLGLEAALTATASSAAVTSLSATVSASVSAVSVSHLSFLFIPRHRRLGII
jgi:hypothetical protein